jgi:hypothetical protein
MSDFADDFYEEDDQPEPRKDPVRARLKQLEKQNSELLKQIEQAAEAQKKLTFMEAGINASDPKFKYFVKGYDGELSADAIRQAAEEAQLITPSQPVTQEDKSAWQQSNRIAAGAETASEGPSWMKRISDASSESELMAIFAEAQAQGIDLGDN